MPSPFNRFQRILEQIAAVSIPVQKMPPATEEQVNLMRLTNDMCWIMNGNRREYGKANKEIARAAKDSRYIRKYVERVEGEVFYHDAYRDNTTIEYDPENGKFIASESIDSDAPATRGHSDPMDNTAVLEFLVKKSMKRLSSTTDHPEHATEREIAEIYIARLARALDMFNGRAMDNESLIPICQKLFDHSAKNPEFYPALVERGAKPTTPEYMQTLRVLDGLQKFDRSLEQARVEVVKTELPKAKRSGPPQVW